MCVELGQGKRLGRNSSAGRKIKQLRESCCDAINWTELGQKYAKQQEGTLRQPEKSHNLENHVVTPLIGSEICQTAGLILR
jgi:hypothetical protein